MVPAGSRRAARRSDAGDGSPEASTRSVQRACCAGRRGVLRLAGHGSGRRACTSPAWRARGAGRARDDRDHGAPKPMATLAPGAPKYGARRRRKNAPSAASHASTRLRYQISPRASASGGRLRHLHLDRERGCTESGPYDKTQRRETWQTRVRSLLAGALASP